MFNLLISFNPDTWNLEPYECDKTRFGEREYTVPEIATRFKPLNDEAIKQLKSFCCLFMVETDKVPSRIGYITDIKNKSDTIRIKYSFDPIFPQIPAGTIKKLIKSLDISDFEMNRTHWAVKDEDLLDILLEHKVITQEQIDSSQRLRNESDNQKAVTTRLLDKRKVFIVHGRDDSSKQQMARFIEKLDLESIILHEQANQGMTIIEKIESYTDVGFSVVLYTPCDIGGLASKKQELNNRARQNVVFEHGYLIGKLGRDKVSAFVKGDVEIPTDISGLLYTRMDDSDAWKSKLVLS